MKVYQIDIENFGKYRHLLPELLKKPSMCGVFSEGCGHCQNMKPAWNQLKSAASSMPGDGSLIEIDSSILPQIQIPALTNRISGYPTILLFRNGVAKEEYGGDRSFQDMHRFLKQHIDSNSDNHSQEKHEVKAINDDYDTTTDEEHDTSSDEEDDVVKKPKIANKKKLSSKKLSLKKSSGIKKSKRRRERKKTTLKGGTRKKAKKARKKMRSRHHHKSIGCCNKRRCDPQCICGTRCNPKCRCPCCK